MRLIQTVCLEFFMHFFAFLDNEERIAGGGCLELKKRVAELLGLDEDSITGNWDFAHKMQLVWNDVLKEKSWIMDLVKIYFSAMKSMNCGKASTHFFEKASELGNLVLTNKTG